MNKIAFVSTNKSSWGGSEYLWYETLLKFFSSGCKVIASTPCWKEIPDAIGDLKSKNIPFFLNTSASKFKKIYNRLTPSNLQLSQVEDGYKFLIGFNPELVVINQGGNSGGIDLMEFCIKKNFKFVSIIQAANEAKWPSDELSKRLALAYPQAMKNYFVSDANIKLTELQIGQKISNSKIIFNPFNVEYENNINYPEVNDFYFMANVARLEFFAKGQDILFQVLNEKKWRDRNLIVNLYGKGLHQQSVEKLKNFLNLSHVKIQGHIKPMDIWRQNHALILTSRYEGLPLALVEAMLCSRPGVVTQVSGNPEVIIDNENGFLAKAANAEFVDEALERAWIRRKEWESIGGKAKNFIRSIIPKDPAEYFYNELVNLGS